MGHIKFVAILLMTMVFAVALTTYVIQYGSDNNAYTDLGNDTELSSLRTGIESEVQVFRSQTNDSAKVFVESKLEGGDEITRTGGQFKGSIGGVISAMEVVFDTLRVKIFGNEEGDSGFGIVLTALISFVAFVGILYLYKAWIGKNPD